MLPTPFAITGKIKVNWEEHKKKLLEDPEFKEECKVLPRPPGAKKLTVRDDYRTGFVWRTTKFFTVSDECFTAYSGEFSANWS